MRIFKNCVELKTFFMANHFQRLPKLYPMKRLNFNHLDVKQPNKIENHQYSSDDKSP